MNNDKSLFFMTLCLICIWLILDNIYGNKYVDNFLSNMFDFYGGDKHASHQDAVNDWANNLDGNPNNKLTEEEERKKKIMENAPNYQW